MLEIRDLHVSYGPVKAVRGIDLDVNKGDVVALIGPNGAGKTSSLRAISGLVPHRGTVRLDGVDCRTRSVEGLARAGLIHVPEGRHLFPTLDVHENLQLGTTAASRRRGGFSFDDVYDLFPPLRPLRARPGWALSGGEQQMVAIGRALVAQPRVLLLDEPSLGLSPKYTTVIYTALFQVSDRIPMLLVEQNTVMALRRCTRGLVIVGGRVVMAGTAADLADREALVASYLGEEPALAGEEAALRRDRVPGPTDAVAAHHDTRRGL